MVTKRLFAALALLLGIASAACSSCAPGTEPDFLATRDGKKLHWAKSDLPLAVIADMSMADWEPEIKVGIDKWNAVIDAPIFLYMGVLDTTGFGGGAHMVVFDVGPPEENPKTTIRATTEGVILSAPVFIPAMVPVDFRQRIASHELGHALGLAHDPSDEQSVMYPRAMGDGSGKWRVTPHDRSALLQVYNPAQYAAETADSGQN